MKMIILRNGLKHRRYPRKTISNTKNLFSHLALYLNVVKIEEGREPSKYIEKNNKLGNLV